MRIHFIAVLLVGLALVLCGCGDDGQGGEGGGESGNRQTENSKPSNNPADYLTAIAGAHNKAQQLQVMTKVKNLATAVMMYSTENAGGLPEKLEDLKPLVGNWDDAITHPVTGAKPGFIYVKPEATSLSMANPGQMAVIFVAKDGKPDPDGCKGYADGSVKEAK